MKRFEKCVVAAFAVYLVLGNIPRMGSISRFGGFPVSELMLSLLAIYGYIRYRVSLPRPLFLIAVLFFISWNVGAVTNADVPAQEHLSAFMYAVRIGVVVMASNYIGWILSKGYSLTSVKRLYIGIALAQIAIGIAIYIIFPQAHLLWAFLEGYGVNISGDPHVRRLIGPVFDPNFFGNLLLLPTALLVGDVLTKRGRSAFAGLVVMLIAILMTYSRSSFLGLAVIMVMLSLVILSRRSRAHYSAWSRGVYLVSMGVILSTALVAIYPDGPMRLAERFANMSTDHSAMARWYDFQLGLERLFSFPYMLTGLGYNYIPYVAKQGGTTSSYDQSLMTLLVSFGFPLGTMLIVVLTAWIRSALQWARSSDVGLYASLIAYLVASIVMSMFNNLLFLPLYLFSVLPLLAYSYWKGKDAGSTQTARTLIPQESIPAGHEGDIPLHP